MTAEGIREAFTHLRDGAQMVPLADAARCRSESDWLIGINGTRALTKRMYGSRAGNVASVGRVQTPTLAIIFNRELEIRNFVPRPLLAGHGRVRDHPGHLRGRLPAARLQAGRGRRPGPDRPDLGAGAGRGRRWPPARASRRPPSPRRRRPRSQARPALYDLTTLQREANNRFGLSARRTLQIAQALYERHKMITYPRTDARALPEDYIPTVRQTLANLHGALAPHAAEGAGRGLGAAEQAHFQQRPGLRPLRHHPDHPRGQAPRRDGGEDLRHDRPPLRRGVLSAGGVRHHHAPQHRRRPRLQDRGQGADRPRAGSPSTARAPWTTIARCEGPAGAAIRPTASRRRPEPLARAAQRDHQAAAALHRGHPALRHGGRRQAGGRRGPGRGHEGARPRHAGHPRRHDRRPDQPEVPGTPAARTRADRQGRVAPAVPRRGARPRA